MRMHIEIDLEIETREELIAKDYLGIFNAVIKNSEIIEKLNNFELSFND